MRFKPMQFKLKTLPAIASAAFLAGGFTLAGMAQADVTLNAGAKMFSESNVFGSANTPLKDNYRVLSASVVYFTPLNANETTYFIAQVGANSSAYSTYKKLDNSSQVGSLGLYQQLSSSWSGTVTGRGFSRTTEIVGRDAKGSGATLEIKNQLSQNVWVKGTADQQSSNATLASNSNTAKTYGLMMGFVPFDNTFLNIGYNKATYDYATTSSTTQMMFADVTQRLGKSWYLNGGIAQQKNNLDITNNIASLGLSLSY